jgi:hypothetical protein
MSADVVTNAEDSDPPRPAKRTSVADMWRQKEQAMLAKQGAPKPAPSPARRSFKFEEKKADATNDNRKIEVQSSTENSTNAVNSWKKQGSFKSSQPTANSNSGDYRSKFGGTTNAVTSEATREAEAVPKVDSNEGSTSERTASKKSKFAMMGQKHAARPKKLANFSSYQQQAATADGNPLSPVSMNSAALSEAFDDVFPDEQGEKLSAELGYKRRAPQSEGLQDSSISRQSSAARASEYSSLRVSDSASIPHDVSGGAQRRYYAESDPKDDDSLISGLSSPGSPARSARQQRQNRRSNLESPREEEPKVSAALSLGDAHTASFDSEGFSTVTSAMTGANSPRRSRPKSGLDRVSEAVTEAVITDGFVNESDTNVTAFQDAVQKMSLADLANDMKEEAKAVFENVSMDKISNDFNQSMAAAQESFNRLVQSGNNATETGPEQKEGEPNQAENNEGEPKEGEQHATEQEDGEQKEGDQKEGEQNETDWSDLWQPEPAAQAQPAVQTEPEQTEPAPKEPEKKELEQEAEKSMPVAAPAPPAPKKVLTLPKRPASPVQEEVAIEVEFLQESDDQESDDEEDDV